MRLRLMAVCHENNNASAVRLIVIICVPEK
jgi:hypothetical protein